MILGVIEDPNDVNYLSYFPATSIGVIHTTGPSSYSFLSTFTEVFELFSKARIGRLAYNLVATDRTGATGPFVHAGFVDTVLPKKVGGDVTDEFFLVICTRFGCYYDAFNDGGTPFMASGGGGIDLFYDVPTKAFVIDYNQSVRLSGQEGSGLASFQDAGTPNLSAATGTVLGRSIKLYEGPDLSPASSYTFTGTVDLDVLTLWAY